MSTPDDDTITNDNFLTPPPVQQQINTLGDHSQERISNTIVDDEVDRGDLGLWNGDTEEKIELIAKESARKLGELAKEVIADETNNVQDLKSTRNEIMLKFLSAAIRQSSCE